MSDDTVLLLTLYYLLFLSFGYNDLKLQFVKGQKLQLACFGYSLKNYQIHRLSLHHELFSRFIDISFAKFLNSCVELARDIFNAICRRVVFCGKIKIHHIKKIKFWILNKLHKLASSTVKKRRCNFAYSLSSLDLSLARSFFKFVHDQDRFFMNIYVYCGIEIVPFALSTLWYLNNALFESIYFFMCMKFMFVKGWGQKILLKLDFFVLKM